MTTPRIAFGDAAAAETLARNEQAARQSIAALARRTHLLTQRLVDLSARVLEGADQQVDQARSQLAASRDRELTNLATRHSAEASKLAEDLTAEIDILAAGVSCLPWSDLVTTSPGDLSRFVRVGTFELGAKRLPALVPFVGHPGLFVSGPRDQVDAMLVGVLVRVVLQAHAKRVRVVTFDPRARGLLGRFAPLRQVTAESFPTPTSNPRVFADRLGAVLEQVSRDAEIVTAASSGDLVDLWKSSDLPEGTLQVVVLVDYPFGVDETLHQQLMRIAATESPVRPVLLVGTDRSSEPADGVTPASLREALCAIDGTGESWRVPGYPTRLVVTDDGPPSDAELTAALSAVVESAKSDHGPTVPLTELMGDDLDDPWRHDSTDGLDVVFGKAGRGLLELSLRTENPPHPNMLVGGMVGTGKSNLLLDIVYGLAIRYSPDEFQVHLLDFKQGLEFARFAPDAEGRNWLPHVRTLGLESDRAFGIAVLDWFLDELERRSELFKSAGQSGIVGYRRATGTTVPRLLLIVDEFHELFAGNDAERERAVEALERLAKQGRVYGVHLLLASQTTSGVSALAVKGDGIFAQFPLRLSLKNTSMESEAILSQGNKAAADLSYRGEVVFNKNAGHSPETSNQTGIAAFADPEEMAALQARLWKREEHPPPLIFLGKEYAAWPALGPARVPSGLEIWLGRPMKVDDVPRTHLVAEDADQTVVVLGQTTRAGVSPRDVLRTLMITAAYSMTHGEVVVLDGDGAPADGWFEELEARLLGKHVNLVRIDAATSATWIRTTLKDRLAARDAQSKLLVVGLSVQKLRDLDRAEQTDEDPYGLEDRSARAVLQDLSRRGAQSGVFFFGSWNNLRTLESDLGSFGSGASLHLTLDLGLEDLRSLVGPAVQRVEGSPRIGVFDRAAGDRLEVLIPYSPLGVPQGTVIS